MQKILVLNFDYSFLNVVDKQRAFRYIASGKVTVEQYSDQVINSFEKAYKLPIVVRFVKFIRKIYRRKVYWSKKNVIIRDNNTCQYCGSKKDITIDHIMPKSRGGKNSFENTVASCFSCNNAKGDKTPREAYMTLQSKPTQPTVMDFLMKFHKTLNAEELLEKFWSSFKNENKY